MHSPAPRPGVTTQSPGSVRGRLAQPRCAQRWPCYPPCGRSETHACGPLGELSHLRLTLNNLTHQSSPPSVQAALLSAHLPRAGLRMGFGHVSPCPAASVIPTHNPLYQPRALNRSMGPRLLPAMAARPANPPDPLALSHAQPLSPRAVAGSSSSGSARSLHLGLILPCPSWGWTLNPVLPLLPNLAEVTSPAPGPANVSPPPASPPTDTPVQSDSSSSSPCWISISTEPSTHSSLAATVNEPLQHQCPPHEIQQDQHHYIRTPSTKHPDMASRSLATHAACVGNPTVQQLGVGHQHMRHIPSRHRVIRVMERLLPG